MNALPLSVACGAGVSPSTADADRRQSGAPASPRRHHGALTLPADRYDQHPFGAVVALCPIRLSGSSGRSGRGRDRRYPWRWRLGRHWSRRDSRSRPPNGIGAADRRQDQGRAVRCRKRLGVAKGDLRMTWLERLQGDAVGGATQGGAAKQRPSEPRIARRWRLRVRAAACAGGDTLDRKIR